MSKTIAKLRLPLLLGAGLLALFLACRWSPQEVEDAWHQVDLWHTRPQVSGVEQDAARPRQRWATLRGRELKVLEQRVGQELAWRLELGNEPRLSFRPVPEQESCIYQVAVRDQAGKEHYLLKESFPPGSQNPPRVVVVDLPPPILH